MSPKTTASSSLPLKQNFTLMGRSFSINLNTRQHNPYVHKKNIFDVVISIIFFPNFTPTFHQFHLFIYLIQKLISFISCARKMSYSYK